MLIYPEIRKNDSFAVIDGYSNRKTITGAVNEMGRYIRDNVNKLEGETILEYGKASLIPHTPYNNDGYFFEIEDVPCASRLVDENSDEIEYTDANWYLVCRIVIG